MIVMSVNFQEVRGRIFMWVLGCWFRSIRVTLWTVYIWLLSDSFLQLWLVVWLGFYGASTQKGDIAL